MIIFLFLASDGGYQKALQVAKERVERHFLRIVHPDTAVFDGRFWIVRLWYEKNGIRYPFKAYVSKDFRDVFLGIRIRPAGLDMTFYNSSPQVRNAIPQPLSRSFDVYANRPYDWGRGDAPNRIALFYDPMDPEAMGIVKDLKKLTDKYGDRIGIWLVYAPYTGTKGYEIARRIKCSDDPFTAIYNWATLKTMPPDCSGGEQEVVNDIAQASYMKIRRATMIINGRTIEGRLPSAYLEKYLRR